MQIEKANDGTVKLLFEGYHAVIIPMSEGKNTLCISSQVGCAMGCTFCYTAKMGFIRNLSKEEIIEQFECALDYLGAKTLKDTHFKKSKDHAHAHITALVFMGMGEPLNNTTNVLNSIEYLHDQYMYPFKKITVSTSGILPEMIKFNSYKNKVHLALSLHSPFQDVRDKIMPLCKQWKIPDLVKAVNDYSSTRKFNMMIEYIMIDGLTDREEDLQGLINLGFVPMTNFNLIPLNGTMTLDGKKYGAPSRETLVHFWEELQRAGHKAFIRKARGDDIEAACGMLNHENI